MILCPFFVDDLTASQACSVHMNNANTHHSPYSTKATEGTDRLSAFWCAGVCAWVCFGAVDIVGAFIPLLVTEGGERAESFLPRGTSVSVPISWKIYLISFPHLPLPTWRSLFTGRIAARRHGPEGAIGICASVLVLGNRAADGDIEEEERWRDRGGRERERERERER